ncbi:MAG: Lrp/AsnC family transcriptional regulator [Pyrinomonadaceae bacterium]
MVRAGFDLISGRTLDETGWRILRELQENARLSFAELGRRLNLSTPAVAERVRRMEESGIITGYRAEVDAKKLGLPITAFIRLSEVSRAVNEKFIAVAGDRPEVLECHRLTGSDCFIMKVVVPSVAHLEALIDRLAAYGTPTTTIVLSSPVTKQVIERIPDGEEKKSSPARVAAHARPSARSSTG